MENFNLKDILYIIKNKIEKTYGKLDIFILCEVNIKDKKGYIILYSVNIKDRLDIDEYTKNITNTIVNNINDKEYIEQIYGIININLDIFKLSSISLGKILDDEIILIGTDVV